MVENRFLADDGNAPSTRSQWNAAIGLPTTLGYSGMHFWDALNGPGELPAVVYVVGLVLVFVLAAVWLSQMHGRDERDERKVLVELESIRNAFCVLSLGTLLLLPMAADHLHSVAVGLVFLSFAVASAFVLFYSRRGA